MQSKAAIITAVDPFEFRGGIETYTVQLVETLKKHDIGADVYHTGIAKETHDFHNDYLGRLYQTGGKIITSGEDYDLVIANAFYGLGYFPPRAKTYNIFHSNHMGFAEAIKDVVPRNQYLEWKYLWGDFCESVSGFNRIKIAVSESVEDELKKHYGFDDVNVIHNCVDTKTFKKSDTVSMRKKWGVPESAFVGLYVGRWDILKGSDILERAISRTPEVYWVIVLGTGSDKSAVPVMDNVKVIEQVEHAVMGEIYSAADFMLFPSRYEGFGYVIIEAMACELPVISTNVGIARTIYKDQPFHKLLLPEVSGGVEEIVLAAQEKIECVRTNKRQMASLLREGRMLIEKEFNIEKWEKRIAAVLGI